MEGTAVSMRMRCVATPEKFVHVSGSKRCCSVLAGEEGSRGCSGGEQIDRERMADVEIGTSPVEEILRWLGPKYDTAFGCCDPCESHLLLCCYRDEKLKLSRDELRGYSFSPTVSKNMSRLCMVMWTSKDRKNWYSTVDVRS